MHSIGILNLTHVYIYLYIYIIYTYFFHPVRAVIEFATENLDSNLNNNWNFSTAVRFEWKSSESYINKVKW